MKKANQKKIQELQATAEKYELLKAQAEAVLEKSKFKSKYEIEYIEKYNSLLTRVYSAINYFKSNN
jgi:hypothetical protein